MFINIINLLFHDQSGLNFEHFFEIQNATLIWLKKLYIDGAYILFYFLIRLLVKLILFGSISSIPNLSKVSLP